MENVIFEKNATAKLAQKAKDFGKILIITSPSAKKQYFHMLSNFLNENKTTFWAYSLRETKCSSDNILKACSFARDAKAIVSLGAVSTTSNNTLTFKLGLISFIFFANEKAVEKTINVPKCGELFG